ncbi:hypothetical protein CLOM_g6758 [Closterium sp. NIES-68]|nr:hypothetical protein CLOM_g6758 [Closterium sp. NIES-68]
MSFESSQTWPASSTKVKKPQQAKKVKPPLVRDDEPIDVLYEDDWLLVVNKPAGVKHQPLHRFVGGALINRVAHYLQADPFTVHRLDMFTSGVICFAKSRSVSQTLHQAFRTKDQISKQYLVLVDIPVTAVPITGRTHQIRVHLQHAKLPVLADHIYGALLYGASTAGSTIANNMRSVLGHLRDTTVSERSSIARMEREGASMVT